MALQAAFKERFEDMESSRNHRLSLLQAEKEFQKNKSLVLSAKHSSIALLEQRCLILDHSFASDNFRISSLKSQIDFLDRKYQKCSAQFRDLKCEVEGLEQLHVKREQSYINKCAEMNGFMDMTHKFAVGLRNKVGELRGRRNELKLLCSELQKNNGYGQNADIQAAEIRNSELLALKKKVANTLESNKRERSELQNQLQCLR